MTTSVKPAGWPQQTSEHNVGLDNVAHSGSMLDYGSVNVHNCCFIIDTTLKSSSSSSLHVAIIVT